MEKTEASELQDLVGQRVEQKMKFGTIRFIGKLLNNPKAGDDLWLGIEWDEEGSGRNNGTVDGHTYFVQQLNLDETAKPSSSFIRYGKIKIGGIDFKEACMMKYKPDSMLSEEEMKLQWQKEQADLYV